MDGASVSLAAAAALEKLPQTLEGRIVNPPEIRSDNGSCYISREFKGLLREYELTHPRIKPHCPEENGLVERSNRTLREVLEEMEFSAPREEPGDQANHTALGSWPKRPLTSRLAVPRQVKQLTARSGPFARPGPVGRFARVSLLQVARCDCS
jgi:transposase InsO family protein